MVSATTTIKNASGLHARPASMFVLKAKGFTSDISIEDVDKGSAPANAKSIMMILAQGMGCGTTVRITAKGPDERAAVDSLIDLLESGCGE
ncbi:MAG: HPr family phosphocarrier protein [Atopobiaceae bacterium]|jgi:phosphocarrier protein|nr:HPr family phosphocarrier protein [Atopobiaceae bacterium]MCI2172815.1 HPr family phosphocarrier protein [Atopobiaceae bacterium]MCI2207122.1 HPr family phosphocarrier protein [Atopobiaceae bacterium]